MAPRATQSQRRGGTHSQRQGGTQMRGYGGRRRVRRVEEEEEEAEQQEDEEQEGEEGDEEMGDETTAEEKMAADLVRLALFTEYKHAPLRRDDINKKVLGKHTRSFRMVFSAAERTLKETFGMELVPLQSAGARDRLVLEETADPDDTTGVKKKLVNAGPRSWMLRTCLPQTVVQLAAEHDQSLAEVEEDDWALLPDDPTRPEHAPGRMMAWQTGDDVALQGLMFVILSLVLVNGRSVPDPQLRSYLKKLGVYGNMPLVTSSGKSITLDTYLSTLTKLGYLDRLRTHLPGLGTQAPAATQASRGGRRARGADNDAEEGDVAFEWRWGARAQAEVGEKGVGEFIADVYLKRREEVAELEASDDEEEEEEGDTGRRGGRGNGRGRGRGREDPAAERRRERRAKKEKERKDWEKVMREVERAAGGELSK